MGYFLYKGYVFRTYAEKNKIWELPAFTLRWTPLGSRNRMAWTFFIDEATEKMLYQAVVDKKDDKWWRKTIASLPAVKDPNIEKADLPNANDFITSMQVGHEIGGRFKCELTLTPRDAVGALLFAFGWLFLTAWYILVFLGLIPLSWPIFSIIFLVLGVVVAPKYIWKAREELNGDGSAMIGIWGCVSAWGLYEGYMRDCNRYHPDGIFLSGPGALIGSIFAAIALLLSLMGIAEYGSYVEIFHILKKQNGTTP